MTIEVRYEIRLIEKSEEFDGTFQEPTIIVCARRAEAVDHARELSAEHPRGWVEAWQIGTCGGDPATATSLIWSRNLKDRQ